MNKVSQKSAVGKPADDMRMLGELIDKYYAQLISREIKNVKIGDFIKMIETRRKLAPMDAEQKKLWSLIEEVRKEKLGKDTGRKAGKRKTEKDPA